MEKTFLQLQKEQQEREDRVNAILDKIMSKMKEFKAVAPATARRVILELLQNAKDAAQPSGVNVEIYVSNDQLVFKHDGACFEIKHVNGLVDRISRKNRDGVVDLNDRKTGRFGTGFICTHLLGEDVLVKGVVMLQTDESGTKQFKRFQIPLKIRENQEDLRNCLLESEKILDDIWTGNGGEVISGDYVPNGFETEFIYDTRNSQGYVDIALSDCMKTLPLTLAANPKIRSVRVIDARNQSDVKNVTYWSQFNYKSENVNEVLIHRNDEIGNKYFIYSNGSENSETSLIIPVSPQNEVMSVDATLPKLLVDFPLVGTEDFRLPFYLNCWKFEPNTERNGISLIGIGEKVVATRKLFSNALSMYSSFVDFLIDQHVENRYNLLSTNVASITSQWKDDADKKWMKDVQTWWRSLLTDKKLIKTDAGSYISLNELVLPDCQLDNLQRLKSLMDPFAGVSNLPAYDIVKECHKVLCNDYSSWGIGFKRSIRDFIKQISGHETLMQLQSKLAFDENNTVDWLSNVYSLLKDSESIKLLDEFPILPNERGILKKKTELYRCVSDDVIEDDFKDIAEFAHTSNDWRGILLDQRFTVEEIGIVNTASIYTDIKNAYDALLKKEDADKLNDLDYNPKSSRTLELAVKVLALKSECEGGKIAFDFANSFKWNFEFPERRPVANSKGFDWRAFENRVLEATCNVTAKSETLDGLSELIDLSEPDCVAWVDELISLCLSNENHKKYVEKDYGVWLNQNNEFCMKDDIIGYVSEPIADEIKDLTRDSELIDHDWRSELLHQDCVHASSFKRAYTLKDILSEVDEILGDYEGNKQDPKFSKVIFALNQMIPDIIPSENVRSYMSRFDSNKNEWIVGAINDKKRMSHIAQLATVDDETFDDTVALYNLVKDNNLSFDIIKQMLSHDEPGHDETRDDDQRERDFETGRKGEEFAFRELSKMGYSNINWLNKDGESMSEYDIEAERDGVKYYFEVKSTRTSFDDIRKIDFYVSKNQFDLANRIELGDMCCIIRVFDVFGKPMLKFLEVKQDSTMRS